MYLTSINTWNFEIQLICANLVGNQQIVNNGLLQHN